MHFKLYQLRREFFINISIVVFINFLIKPFYLLFVETEVQNLLGNDYGLYFEVLSFVFLFQFINEPGLQQFNVVKLSQTNNSKSYFDHLISLKLALSMSFIFIVLMSGLLGGYNLKVIFWIALGMALSSLFILFRSSISAHGNYRTDSLISALDRIFLIIILLFLMQYYANEFSIYWFVIAQVCAATLALIISIFIYRKQNGAFHLRWSKIWNATLLKKLKPFTIIIFLMMAYTKIDGIMLGYLSTQREISVYAAGFRFFEAANMVGVLAAGILLPMYSRSIDDKPNLMKLVKTGTLILTFLLGSAVVFLLLLKTKILSFFYDQYTEYYDVVFQYIILALIPLILIHVFGPLLLSMKKLKILSVIFFIALLTNAFLNWKLIPIYNAEGAAIATLLTQTFAALGTFMVAIYEYNKLEISSSKQ